MPLIRNLSWEDQSMWVAWTGASWRQVPPPEPPQKPDYSYLIERARTKKDRVLGVLREEWVDLDRVVADTRIERQTVRHYLNEWVWAGQVERKWTPTERRGGKPKPWYRRVR